MAKSRAKGVVEQIRIARQNPVPAVLGAVMGAIVPVLVYQVVHRHLDPSRPIWMQWAEPLTYMAMGGLVFSAKTVYQWAVMAFNCRYKAAGFVVLLEGVMVFAPGHLPLVCLAYLVGINAIATGAHLALADAPKRRRQATAPEAGAERTRRKPRGRPQTRATRAERGQTELQLGPVGQA